MHMSCTIWLGYRPVYVVRGMVDSGKDAIVAGLNSGNDRRPFAQMAELAMTAEDEKVDGKIL